MKKIKKDKYAIKVVAPSGTYSNYPICCSNNVSYVDKCINREVKSMNKHLRPECDFYLYKNNIKLKKLNRKRT